MDLVGRLSNHDLTALLQRLTTLDWRQDSSRHRHREDVAPDGRRKFGAVRDAIVAVLEQADGELRVREIHAGVEARMGEPVSRGSVKSYMRAGCQRKAPLFEYLGKRGYRLTAKRLRSSA